MDVGVIILAASSLCVAAILAGAAGQKIDAPFLLVFLLVGMLAGREGPGGISVDASEAIIVWASAALAAILFEGGLRTKLAVFKQGAGPGLSLALIGTLLTTALVAPLAYYLFGLGWTEALLIGAIVSSTDAAAVFALAATGLKLPDRIAAALEVESGNNDPIAILLVVGLSTSLAVATVTALDWAILFAQKLGLGALAGFAVGYAAPLVLKRTRLPTGLQSILAAGFGFLALGLAEVIDGSGFLAIYLTGLLIGARAPREAERAGSMLDGLAWLSQTGLFLILGLLITPSHLASVALPALALALGLIFVARPLAVAVCLSLFRFRKRDMTFIAWTGLRGATPVFLGLLPASMGVENGNFYLSVAGVVVLLSLVIQGWTAPVVGRALNLDEETAEPVERGETLARLGAVGASLAVGGWFAISVAPQTAIVNTVSPGFCRSTHRGTTPAVRNDSRDGFQSGQRRRRDRSIHADRSCAALCGGPALPGTRGASGCDRPAIRVAVSIPRFVAGEDRRRAGAPGDRTGRAGDRMGVERQPNGEQRRLRSEHASRLSRPTGGGEELDRPLRLSPGFRGVPRLAI